MAILARKMWSVCIIAAHTLAGTSASYGFPLFAEISGKLAHIFQYALNATIAADAAGPLVEFISEAVALLESRPYHDQHERGGV